MTVLARVEERLATEAEEGVFCTGVQAYVSVAGEVVLDGAWGRDGLGRPMTTQTLSAVYCALKPMTALVVGHLVDRGELSLDDRLGDLLACAPGLDSVQIDQLLDHTAGVHVLRSTIAAAASSDLRRVLAVSTDPAPGWLPSSQAGYSEWSAWYLLKLVIEEVTGRGLGAWLQELIVGPLELDDDLFLGIPVDRYDVESLRIGVNVDLRSIGAVPLLMERVRSFATDDDPSLSGFATMRALGAFYELVLACFGDRAHSAPLSSAMVRTFATPHRSRRYDVVLDTSCAWTLGFMADLQQIGFGPHVGPRAVGHCGQVGTSTAFCDPDHEIVCAVLVNGLIDQATGMAIRRPALVNDLYRDLGLVTGGGSHGSRGSGASDGSVVRHT